MGVTHRDLKPEVSGMMSTVDHQNILLASVPGEKAMTVKIADFGLAKMGESPPLPYSMAYASRREDHADINGRNPSISGTRGGDADAAEPWLRKRC